MSMVSISLFSFNNFMVGVIFRLYGINYSHIIGFQRHPFIKQTVKVILSLYFFIILG